MNTSAKLFRHTAVFLFACAVVVAILNLHMNFLATRKSTSFQIDLTADGDLMAFHQFDYPHHTGPDGHRKRRNEPVAKKAHHDDGDHQKSGGNSCMGLCPPVGSTMPQTSFVQTLVHARTRKFSAKTFAVHLDGVSKHITGGCTGDDAKTVELNGGNLTYTWKTVVAKYASSPSIIYDLDHRQICSLISLLHRTPIQHATTAKKGTQLKAMLFLEGSQWAVWKPKFMDIGAVIEDGPTDGPDRHNAEIAAFYLGVLLKLHRTPFVIGRTLDIRKELYEVADKTFKSTFLQNNSTNRLCFYGKCMYCSINSPICANKDDRLEGALVLWLPETFANLSRVRSPWARTYDKGRLANWETNPRFCSSVIDHSFFGQKHVLLDLMDMAVFDFLLGNADRHRLEYVKTNQPPTVLLLDNGKAFRNPNVDELSILAPLYQCCKIRRRMYHQLLKHVELNFGGTLNDLYLKRDPLYPILTAEDLAALNRRLRKVLAVLASCIEQHGDKYVLLDD